MAKLNGLGRGLDAFFPESFDEDQSSEYRKISINLIEPKTDQPRKTFDEESLTQLAASISAHGLLQPILVREIPNERYQIIAGERRWRACKMAGLKEIPVIVSEEADEETAKLSLIENIQREDLNPLEEALAYKTLMLQFGLTQEKLSEEVGKSRSAIANALRLLDLPEDLIPYVKQGLLTAGHARTLLGCKSTADMIRLAMQVIDGKLSVRDLEAAVKKANKPEKPAEPQVVKLDYAADLSKKLQTYLGRRVQVSDKSQQKYVQLYYEDNEDLEELLLKLCGQDFIDTL